MAPPKDLKALRGSNDTRIHALEARGFPTPGLPGLYVQTLLEELLGDLLESAQWRYESRLPEILTRIENQADAAEREYAEFMASEEQRSKDLEVRQRLGIA